MIDFYDYDALEILQEERARMWLQLMALSESGDKQAKKALTEHNRDERIIKRRANAAGYHWA